MKTYSYGIIKENYPELERESTVIESPYKNSKYACIEKDVHEDGTEVINQILYSDSLDFFSEMVEREYISWYNYPKGKSKSIQGYINDLS